MKLTKESKHHNAHVLLVDGQQLADGHPIVLIAHLKQVW